MIEYVSLCQEEATKVPLDLGLGQERHLEEEDVPTVLNLLPASHYLSFEDGWMWHVDDYHLLQSV